MTQKEMIIMINDCTRQIFQLLIIHIFMVCVYERKHFIDIGIFLFISGVVIANILFHIFAKKVLHNLSEKISIYIYGKYK